MSDLPNQHMTRPVLPPPPRRRPQTPTPPRRRRVRRSTAAGIAIAAAVAAGAATASVTVGKDTAAPGPAATVTVSVSAPPPSTPSPRPAPDADRATCTAYSRANTLLVAALTAISVIPTGTTITDPPVRATPDFASAVTRAADLFQQASRTLAAGISPGSTAVLSDTAAAAVSALSALSRAYSTYDENNGDVFAMARSATNATAALCDRLAP